MSNTANPNTVKIVEIPEEILADLRISSSLEINIDELTGIANEWGNPKQAESCYTLARYYLTQSEFTDWFYISALRGYIPALHAIAKMMPYGLWEESSLHLRVNETWFADRHSDEEVRNDPALKSLANQKHQAVLDLAAANNMEAIYYLGDYHESGLYPIESKNNARALEYFKKASDLGYPKARLKLAEIYATGSFGEKDLRLALKYQASAFEVMSLDHYESKYNGGITVEDEHLSTWAKLIIECGEVPVCEKIQEWAKSVLEDEDGLLNWWDGAITASLILSFKNNIKSPDFSDKSIKLLTSALRLEIVHHLENLLSDLDEYFSETSKNLHFSWYKTGGAHEPNEDNRCNNMHKLLEEYADHGVIPAQYFSALFLLDHAKDSEQYSRGVKYLRDASNGGLSLASLHYGNLILTGVIRGTKSEAKEYLYKVSYQIDGNIGDFPDKYKLRVKNHSESKEIVTADVFHEMSLYANHLIQEIELEETALQAKERAQKDMLSYLTHTLNNTLSSGPESARQAMRILGSELYENNREYKAINNIASMFSTFLFAQQLLKTFKLYIAEPETLRLNWDADVEGDATIAVALAVTLRQTLSQVVFASNHQAALQRLLPHKDAGAVKTIRKAFMDEIVPLDVDASNTAQVLDWVQHHLGLIHVSVDTAAELHFRSNSTRYTYFFSSFSELIYNALKYSDGAHPIEISWGRSGEKAGGEFVFRCVNTWTEDSIQSSEGSGKGLVYLARLAEMLGAKFEKHSENQRFVAEIHFPETLLKG